MPRRRNPPRRQRPLPPLPATRRIESGPDGYEYEVRPIAAAGAIKSYRGPGGDHEIRPGAAHLVVGPADLGEQAVDERRHWHTPCWTQRATRGPTRRWS